MQLNDLVISTPLELWVDKPVDIKITVEGNTINMFSLKDGQWSDYARARGQYIVSKDSATSLEQLKRECFKKVSIKTIYDLNKHAGFVYGPAFQTLKELYVGKAQVLAFVQTQLSEHADSICFPPLLDGALQASACLFLEKLGVSEDNTDVKHSYLPSSFGTVSVYQSCWIYARTDSMQENENEIRADIEFIDENGIVLAVIKRFTARIAKNTVPQKAEHFFVPVWEPYEAVAPISKRQYTVFDARERGYENLDTKVAEKLLLFAQKLNAHNSGPILVITEHAYAVSANDLVNLNQTMLNGFLKSMMLELPQIVLMHVDVDNNVSVDEVLERAHSFDQEERIFALRGKECFVLRIESLGQRDKQYNIFTLPDNDYALQKGAGNGD